VRALPTTQRRLATLASVTGHCVVLALLAFLGARTEPLPLESALILAELVPAAPEPVATTAATAAEPSPQPPRAEPAPQPQPPATEAEREPPAPPSPPPRAEPVQPERRVPQNEPEPVERVVDVPPPSAEPTAELPADEPPLAGGDVPVDAIPPSAIAAVRSFDGDEQRTVERRLASWTGRFSAEAPGETLEWRDGGREYTAVLTPLPAADAMGMEQLLVELTTQRDGQRLVTELRMNRIAFSNFAQFVDRWDPGVQIHDDLIDGRFHSNSEIRVSQDRRVRPIFNGKVTVAGADVRAEGPGYLNRREMFPAGIETRVRRIGLPSRSAAFDDGAVPADRVHRIALDSLLTFHADGTFDSHAVADGTATGRGTLGEEPFYVVAEEEVELHVRGAVNGKVLVYSPEDIVIVDDLRYVDDPRAAGADDYLGLVAERSIEIAEPEVTGPGDLEVHASIYARTRFAVRDTRSRRSGTLIVFGSVTAGSISATEPRFATRIEFDDRLTTMRAPGFPLSDRYELDSAAGEWRVVDAQ
jgi:hypothetical protein